MSRTYRALTTLELSLSLAGTVATTALATPPTGSTTSPAGSAGDVNAQREALYQSELEHNQSNQAARTEAAVEQARAGGRNLAPVVTITAPQPVPAAPASDVNVVAIALLGLLGGLIGGVAVVAGSAANRRRHRVVAA